MCPEASSADYYASSAFIGGMTALAVLGAWAYALHLPGIAYLSNLFGGSCVVAAAAGGGGIFWCCKCRSRWRQNSAGGGGGGAAGGAASGGGRGGLNVVSGGDAGGAGKSPDRERCVLCSRLSSCWLLLIWFTFDAVRVCRRTAF